MVAGLRPAWGRGTARVTRGLEVRLLALTGSLDQAGMGRPGRHVSRMWTDLASCFCRDCVRRGPPVGELCWV